MGFCQKKQGEGEIPRKNESVDQHGLLVERVERRLEGRLSLMGEPCCPGSHGARPQGEGEISGSHGEYGPGREGSPDGIRPQGISAGLECERYKSENEQQVKIRGEENADNLSCHLFSQGKKKGRCDKQREHKSPACQEDQNESVDKVQKSSQDHGSVYGSGASGVKVVCRRVISRHQSTVWMAERSADGNPENKPGGARRESGERTEIVLSGR